MMLKTSNLFLILAYLAAIVFVFLLFSPYITFMILGLILVLFLYPINKRLLKKMKNKVLTSLTMTTLTLIIILLPLAILGTYITNDARQIYNEVITLDLEHMSERITELTGAEVNLEELIFPALIDFRSYLTQAIPSILGFVTELFIKTFLMLFVLYYGFKEGDKIKSSLLKMIPLSQKHKQELVEKTKNVIFAVLYGQFLIALLQGIAGGIAFWIFGIPNPVFWGFIMGVLSFIPLLGPPIVWLPAGLYQIYIGEIVSGVGLILVGVLIIMNIDNFLKPKLIGGKSGMHPIVVLVGILGGISLFGFIGFVIGPILLAISLLIIKFFNEDYTANLNTAHK
ncbi:MAG: AI-2E family transporter [Candidatus Woesearchaeota archaeon]